MNCPSCRRGMMLVDIQPERWVCDCPARERMTVKGNHITSVGFVPLDDECRWEDKFRPVIACDYVRLCAAMTVHRAWRKLFASVKWNDVEINVP